MAARQLQAFLGKLILWNHFSLVSCQSLVSKTALVALTDYLLHVKDNESVLIFLDLLAASDTTNRNNLLDRNHGMGVPPLLSRESSIGRCGVTLEDDTDVRTSAVCSSSEGFTLAANMLPVSVQYVDNALQSSK